jgi:catechol 2,3-dioxygenase-like lactoylglutathione lyase family enzyme
MPTPALKVTEINHVVLHVTDLERSRRFYLEVLGFEDRTLRVNPGQATNPGQTMSFLQGGAQGLDLFQVSSGDVHGGKEMNHMALCVAADDVDEVAGALERAGVEVSEKTPRNSVFISDPDGHRIEILPRSANARALLE